MKIFTKISLNEQTFFPFLESEALVKYADVLIKRVADDYPCVSVSTFSEVGEFIRSVAEEHDAKLCTSEGRIFISNPNHLYLNMEYTWAKNVTLYFEGLIIKHDASDIFLCVKLIE